MMVLFAVSWGYPQSGPWNISLDSSFRMEFLFGTQALRDRTAPIDVERFRIDSNFRLPVLAGNVEITPLVFLSGRLGGLTSVLEGQGTYDRSAADFDILLAERRVVDAKPTFNGWEAAGLFHLWNDGGYRFSVTAGYREEFWGLDGQGLAASGTTSFFHEKYQTRVPFLGLQTAMFFPWWKARFELIGSRWMTKVVSGALTDTVVSQYEAKATGGGLLELQMEGTAGITQNIFAGLHGRYTFQESFGELIRKGNLRAPDLPLELYMNDSFLLVGVDLTVAF
jgi:hypothetical protein